MYYANPNISYMQDLNLYNQINPSIERNSNNFNQYGMPMQFIPYNQMQTQSFQNNNQMMGINQLMQTNNELENMYPSIYKIINPVVERVVDGTISRNQIIDETTLNNMVDTVFNIVEGQIERDLSMPNNNVENRTVNSNQTRNERNMEAITSKNNVEDRSSGLIKDIIKILTIRTIIEKNNARINYFYNMQTNNPGIMRTNFF